MLFLYTLHCCPEYSLAQRTCGPPSSALSNHLTHRAGTCNQAGQADLTHQENGTRQSASIQLSPPMHRGRRRQHLRPTQAQHLLVSGSKLRETYPPSYSAAHVPTPYPASLFSHMTKSVCGVPCSKFQRQVINSNDING